MSELEPEYTFGSPISSVISIPDDASVVSLDLTLTQPEPPKAPTDIAVIPDELAIDPDDKLTPQSDILNEIIGTADDSNLEDKFVHMVARKLKLSKLKAMYESKDENVLSLLKHRHRIHIDEEFTLEMGLGKIRMDTKSSMIDYHLTVGNCMGFSPLLPNARSDPHFCFEMDLKMPCRDFKGKNGMLGFDPAGKMLYVGRCRNEDVYLAMAPNEFLRGYFTPVRAGYSTGESVMSTRHYRQTVIMIAHFLELVPELAFFNPANGYDQSLDSASTDFARITRSLGRQKIRLNVEALRKLDDLILEGYRDWVCRAPEHWKADGFLTSNSPIVVTSCFGQNAAIALEGDEYEEAEAWDRVRDYNKIAFLTVAIATSIQYAPLPVFPETSLTCRRCTEIQRWASIRKETLISENPRGLYDSPNRKTRRKVNLNQLPLLDEEGTEIPIYDKHGTQVPRRRIVEGDTQAACGVLVKLEDIQTLFGENTSSTAYNEEASCISIQDEPFVRLEAYPLGFLRVAGNVKATGVPSCFYPVLTDINRTVRKNHRKYPAGGSDDDNDDPGNGDDDPDDAMNDDDNEDPYSPSAYQAVKPVSSQFYNYLTHRVASRAGAHDSQQGTVTAAISGGYAITDKDKSTARDRQEYCEERLPSERFHGKITSVRDCPSACRAELVYSIDVRALKDPSGYSIFQNIILRLARAWSEEDDIRHTIKNYLLVLKPEAFPVFYDWVAYPVTVLIKKLFEKEMSAINKNVKPCPFRLELLASLERVLCFCHTGNAAVFATSLMNGLGLSKGAISDGFPMLHAIFDQPSILSAMNDGFMINPRRWPLKNHYPAIASKRAQVLTYSFSHFMSYQALFRINFASTINPTKVYPDVRDRKSNKALRICEIAFDAFFDDTRQLVAEGVRKDVKARIVAATSPDERKSAVSRGKIREAALKTWMGSKFPLAYGKGVGHETYNLLVKAVSEDDRVAEYGLRGWDTNALTASAFVEALINMSKEKEAIPPSAPVVKLGAFLPVLKVAQASILDIAKMDGTVSQAEFLRKKLMLALNVFHVRFFPSHAQQSGSRGAPHRVPVFHSWGHLGCKDPAGTSLLLPDPDPSHSHAIEPETIAYNNAVVNDCNAPWAASKLDLLSMKEILNKTTLPVDYGPITPCRDSDGQYVTDAYEWVKRRYDGTNHVHHLALLVSIVVSSTILPRIFMPLNQSDLFKKSSSPEEVRKAYNEMEWVTRNGKRGVSMASIFIAMITTFIIGIYEKESPLRRHLIKNGLGEPWTKKYSVKGVTYTLLIRLGMVWGKGRGAYEKGTFGNAWGPYPTEYLRNIHTRLCGKLKSNNAYGPFDALSILVGAKNAGDFCSTKSFSCRPPTRPDLSNVEYIDAMDVDST